MRVPPEPEPEPEPAPAPAAPGLSTDDLWMACMSAAPDGWSTSDVTEAYAARHGGELPDDASAGQLETFLQELRDGTVGPARRSARESLQERAAEQTPPPEDGSKVPF